MTRIIHALRQRLYFRSAAGCTKHPEPHSHHLTRLGQRHYVGAGAH